MAGLLPQATAHLTSGQLLKLPDTGVHYAYTEDKMRLLRDIAQTTFAETPECLLEPELGCLLAAKSMELLKMAQYKFSDKWSTEKDDMSNFSDITFPHAEKIETNPTAMVAQLNNADFYKRNGIPIYLFDYIATSFFDTAEWQAWSYLNYDKAWAFLKNLDDIFELTKMAMNTT